MVPDEKLRSWHRLPRLLRQWSVDGLLIHYTSQAPAELEEAIRSQRVPAIWINSVMTQDAVFPDDHAAGLRYRPNSAAPAIRQGRFDAIGLLQAPKARPGSTLLSSRVRTTSANTAYLQVQNNGTNGFDTSSASMTLVADNGYRYTATFERLATANTWTFTGLVENLGTTGTAAPVAVTHGSFSMNVTYSGLYNDTSLFAGFRAPKGNGVAELDNFVAVIPEPASLGLMLIGGACLRRRRVG